ncbi:MAG: hypothetical protein ABI566_08070 [Pseudolysinimonas sp.]
MTRVGSWFRSNLWALLAVTVLGTGAVLYSFAFDWVSFQNRQPNEAVDIPRGEPGTLGAGTIVLEDLVVLAGDSDDGRRYDVAEGTDVVVADLRITPDPEGSEDNEDDYQTCDFFFRAPSPVGEREWWQTSYNPTTYPEPEDNGYGCNLGYGEAYDLRTYFVVPAGGADGGYVLASSEVLLPRALRLH